MTKVFLDYCDAGFRFLDTVQPYVVEPSMSTEGVEIPDELWERWQKATKEFKAVGDELSKYIPEDEL